MATQTSVIYGINTRGGLGEVLNYDKALLNLGLDPEDLSLLGRIASSSTGITRDDFYTLSGSTENLFPKISGRVQAARDIVHEAEKTAGAFRTSLTVSQNSTGVSGNVIVNGPIAAPAIRFFSTELLNAAGTDFEPLDISTSRVSSWSRSGNNISYGASLLIDSLGDGPNYNGGAGTSNSPSLGVGSIVIDENEGLTQITPREFNAEQATHKLKVRINGKTYFMYAMKNIPLRFTGNFIGSTSGPIASITPAPDYRVIVGDDSITQTGNSDLTFRSTAEGIKTIEAYVNPATITELEMTGLNLENFPRAEYTALETLNFSGNKISTLPNFKSIAPNLKTLDFSNNPLNNSPERSDPRINKLSQELLNRIPNGDCPTDESGVTNLDLSGCFSGEVTGNFRTTFPNLQILNISGTTGKVLNSPTLPEVGTRVVTYTSSNNSFSSVPGLAPIKVFHDTPASGLDFDGTGSNHGGAKLTLRRLKDRFEVEINSPGGATVYDAYGDGITRNYIRGNVLNGVTGAGSPEGIPFGNLIVETSGGVVTAANFSPVGSYSATHPSIAAPTHTEVLKAGRAFSLANDYDTPFRSVGYYTDAGLLSSPMSITSLTIAGSANLEAINDRNHAWMNLPLTPAHKSYNEDITNVNFDGTEGTGIPFFTPGYTKLKTFSANSMEPARASEVNANLNKVVGAGKFTPATSDSLTEMMQLYDSPTGTYKFSGCTNLETLNLINTRLVGKFPKFVGNDKLKTIQIRGRCHFYQHAASTALKPIALPHDQFTDAALDTVETFDFIKSYGFFNSASFGGYDLNTLTGPARQIFAPGDSYTRYEQAPFETDNDGLTAFDKLKKVKKIRWWSRGTSGPLPTFKNNESKLYWLYLGHNRFGKDFNVTETYGADWGGTVSGGLFNEWRVPSIRTSLRYFWFHVNELKGTINFQNMANADSTTTDDMTRIELLYGDINQLKKIDNWGHNGLPRLDRLYLRNSFRDGISGSDNYYGDDKEGGHLIPSFANKLPRIRLFYLSENVKGDGPFKGFADASEDNIFEGCNRLKVLDLSGNKFSKSAVLEVLRSLKEQKLRNVTVNFKNQINSDSDGDLDFRNDPLADNDLIQSCKDAPFRFTVNGVKNKVVPPAPAAPSTFSHSFTQSGFSSRVTGTTINLGSKEGVFSNWPTGSGIDIRFTISGFSSGTNKIVVKKLKNDGSVSQTVTYNNPTGTITQDFEITTSGDETDINMTDVTSIGTQASSLGASATQTVAFTVQAEGDRGFGSIKTVNLQFKNYTE